MVVAELDPVELKTSGSVAVDEEAELPELKRRGFSYKLLLRGWDNDDEFVVLFVWSNRLVWLTN